MSLDHCIFACFESSVAVKVGTHKHFVRKSKGLKAMSLCERIVLRVDAAVAVNVALLICKRGNNSFVDNLAILKKLAKIKADAEELAKKLEVVSLTIAAKVSEAGAVYGSVGAAQVAEELAKLGFEIDRKIIVAEAAKEVGSYSATIKLHKEVSVKVPFAVVAEAAAE